MSLRKTIEEMGQNIELHEIFWSILQAFITWLIIWLIENIKAILKALGNLGKKQPPPSPIDSQNQEQILTNFCLQKIDENWKLKKLCFINNIIVALLIVLLLLVCCFIVGKFYAFTSLNRTNEAQNFLNETILKIDEKQKEFEWLVKDFQAFSSAKTKSVALEKISQENLEKEKKLDLELAIINKKYSILLELKEKLEKESKPILESKKLVINELESAKAKLESVKTELESAKLVINELESAKAELKSVKAELEYWRKMYSPPTSWPLQNSTSSTSSNASSSHNSTSSNKTKQSYDGKQQLSINSSSNSSTSSSHSHGSSRRYSSYKSRTPWSLGLGKKKWRWRKPYIP